MCYTIYVKFTREEGFAIQVIQWEKLSPSIQIAIDETHRFGTDAFLLEHFASVRGIDKVCDLCAGCGIVGLLMLRRPRPPQAVTAVEISPQAVALMQRTVEASSLAHFSPLQGDLREIRTLLPAHSFRLVTCNPPYFQAGTGYLCPEDSRRRARHEQEESCTIGEICEAAAWLLQYGGRFCLCQRPERLTDVLSAMRQAGLEPKRLRWVQQRAGKAPWLFLVEGKAGAKPGLTVEPPLLVENADGSYSDEMKTIYRIV